MEMDGEELEKIRLEEEDKLDEEIDGLGLDEI